MNPEETPLHMAIDECRKDILEALDALVGRKDPLGKKRMKRLKQMETLLRQLYSKKDPARILALVEEKKRQQEEQLENLFATSRDAGSREALEDMSMLNFELKIYAALLGEEE